MSDILDHHAQVKTKKVIERPFWQWYSLEIKAAKTEKNRKECAWKKLGLTVHKEIYISACHHVNKLVEHDKKPFFKNKFNHVNHVKNTIVNYFWKESFKPPALSVSDADNASHRGGGQLAHLPGQSLPCQTSQSGLLFWYK